MITAVRVERFPYGVTSFSEAHAKLIAEDTLAICCTDADYHAKYGPMQVYQPDRWITATVLNECGQTVQTFTSRTGQALEQARRDRRVPVGHP